MEYQDESVSLILTDLPYIISKRQLENINRIRIKHSRKTKYISNEVEYALSCIKGSKPTFHREYHNGIYTQPIQSDRIRFHPTMKSIQLFEDLIRMHTNEGDIVVDRTTANEKKVHRLRSEHIQKLISLAEGS